MSLVDEFEMITLPDQCKESFVEDLSDGDGAIISSCSQIYNGYINTNNVEVKKIIDSTAVADCNNEKTTKHASITPSSENKKDGKIANDDCGDSSDNENINNSVSAVNGISEDHNITTETDFTDPEKQRNIITANAFPIIQVQFVHKDDYRTPVRPDVQDDIQCFDTPTCESNDAEMSAVFADVASNNNITVKLDQTTAENSAILDQSLEVINASVSNDTLHDEVIPKSSAKVLFSPEMNVKESAENFADKTKLQEFIEASDNVACSNLSVNCTNDQDAIDDGNCNLNITNRPTRAVAKKRPHQYSEYNVDNELLSAEAKETHDEVCRDHVGGMQPYLLGSEMQSDIQCEEPVASKRSSQPTKRCKKQSSAKKIATPKASSKQTRQRRKVVEEGTPKAKSSIVHQTEEDMRKLRVIDVDGAEVDPLHDVDILGGVGGYRDRPGNCRYRDIVRNYSAQYRASEGENRDSIYNEVINKIFATKPKARFLRKHNGVLKVLTEQEHKVKVIKSLAETRRMRKPSHYSPIVQPSRQPLQKTNTVCDQVQKDEPDLKAAPESPNDFPSTRWSWDETERVVRVDLTDCTASSIEKVDRDCLAKMMSRVDIVLIIAGIVSNLTDYMWTEEYIRQRFGSITSLKVRRYCESSESDSRAYLEERGSTKLDISDFLDLSKQKQMGNQLKGNGPCNHTKNLEMPTLFPELYDDFKDGFKLPELLPGSKLCLAQLLCQKSRPYFGPNLYFAFPSCFTQLHQDGFGTIDSGHLNLCGYNEVIMLRRLSHEQKEKACSYIKYPEERRRSKQKYNPVNGLPHDEGRTTLPHWPSNEVYDTWKNEHYLPSRFILKPGEYLHINKGRLHAFRKLDSIALPEYDCHYNLRQELLQEVDMKIPSKALSVAWDWMFMGSGRQSIEEELEYCLSSTLRNKQSKRQSLANPRSCLLRWCQLLCSKTEIASDKSSIVARGLTRKTDTQQHDAKYCTSDLLHGMHKAIKLVLEQELFAIQTTPKTLRTASTDEANLYFDPYDTDYYCKVCSQELPNVYFHCSGCNRLLDKDYNICYDCYENKEYEKFARMQDGERVPLTTYHHHLCGPHTDLEECTKTYCDHCSKCRCCECDCHREFMLRYRFFDKTKLEEMLGSLEEKYENFFNV